MADTTSPLLGLLLMGTGGDNNAWGSNLNTQVFALIEQAIAGVTNFSVTGGTLTLTAAQSRSATIELSGTLASNLTIVVPSTAKKWTFINQCVLSGFEVLIQTSGGTLRNLPGGWNEITSDGSGALARQDGHLVGEFFYSGAATAPAHSLECNGALPLRATYPDLFAKIGTTWGVGDGFTTFGLPNAEDTNRFLRAAGGSLTVGIYQSNTTGPHTHPGASVSLTTSTESVPHTHVAAGTTGNENQSHTHQYTAPLSGGASGTGAGISGATQNLNTGTENQNHTHSFSVTTGNPSTTHTHTVSGTTATVPANTGTTETRPESMVGLLCIRY